MSNLANQDFGSEEEDDDFNPIAADDSDAEQPTVWDGSEIY